eukprot:CAMPEP_0119516756 /NCGR_PEP_ID=MMETSP1344-20130328/33857_1 /TAXON_ID=236787 /ORGANISM="Florenciella parvula, Strain CCMP2471" /LENGTH=932 /DNA_ID=CAMNT_0007554289 /DNA_START=65 /DNA_END=2863 /DNA_ORIENTATION=-
MAPGGLKLRPLWALLTVVTILANPAAAFGSRLGSGLNGLLSNAGEVVGVTGEAAIAMGDDAGTKVKGQNGSDGCMCGVVLAEMEDAKAETQRALEKTTRELERALKELARSKELHVKTKGDLKTCQTLRGEEADPNLVVLAINRTQVFRTGSDAAWALTAVSVRGSKLGLAAAAALATRGYEYALPQAQAAYQYVVPHVVAALTKLERQFTESVDRAKAELLRRGLWTAEHDKMLSVLATRATGCRVQAFGACAQGLSTVRDGIRRLLNFGMSCIQAICETIPRISAAITLFPTFLSDMIRSFIDLSVASVHALYDIGVELIETMAPSSIAAYADVLVTAFLGAMIWQLMLGVGALVRRPVAWLLCSTWALGRAVVGAVVALPTASSRLMALLSFTTTALLGLPLMPFKAAFAAAQHLYMCTVVAAYRRVARLSAAVCVPFRRQNSNAKKEAKAEIKVDSQKVALASCPSPTKYRRARPVCSPSKMPASPLAAEATAPSSAGMSAAPTSPAPTAPGRISTPAIVATAPTIECATKTLAVPRSTKKPSWTSWFPDSPMPLLSLRMATATGRVAKPVMGMDTLRTPTPTPTSGAWTSPFVSPFASSSPTTVATPPDAPSVLNRAFAPSPTASPLAAAPGKSVRAPGPVFGEELKRRASTGGLGVSRAAGGGENDGGLETSRKVGGGLPFGAELLRRATESTPSKRESPSKKGAESSKPSSNSAPAVVTPAIPKRPALAFDAGALLKKSSSLKSAKTPKVTTDNGRTDSTPSRPGLAFDAGALLKKSTSLKSAKTPRATTNNGRADGTPSRPGLSFNAELLLKKSSSLKSAKTPRGTPRSGQANSTPSRPGLSFNAELLLKKSSSLRSAKTPRGGGGRADGTPSLGGRARSASAPAIGGEDMGMLGELQRRMASIRHASSREEEHDSDTDDGGFD